MHVLVLAEGYSDETGFKKFEQEWHGKLYAKGKAKLRVREAKLYTLAINECGRKEFLRDLKGLTGSFKGYGGNTMPGAFRWDRLVKTFRFLLNWFGIKQIDDSKIKANKVGVDAGKSGWNCHFTVIGEVTDHKNKHGTEQV